MLGYQFLALSMSKQTTKPKLHEGSCLLEQHSQVDVVIQSSYEYFLACGDLRDR